MGRHGHKSHQRPYFVWFSLTIRVTGSVRSTRIGFKNLHRGNHPAVSYSLQRVLAFVALCRCRVVPCNVFILLNSILFFFLIIILPSRFRDCPNHLFLHFCFRFYCSVSSFSFFSCLLASHSSLFLPFHPRCSRVISLSYP